MNPFEDNIETNTYIPKIDTIIEIWNEERNRKSDTYISGLPLDKEELINNLKIIKKKKGCNGAIKELLDDNGSVSLILQLQGNQKNFVKEHFNNIGFKNIKLKG